MLPDVLLATSDGHVAVAPGFDVLRVANAALAKWQMRLRLVDWDIWIEIGEVADTNWAAQSDKDWRMRRAHITIPANYIEKVRQQGEVLPTETDAELVESTVIHELLHILEEPAVDAVDADIQWLCGNRDTGGVFWADFRNAWRDYREWWINHMVRAVLDAERTNGWADAR